MVKSFIGVNQHRYRLTSLAHLLQKGRFFSHLFCLFQVLKVRAVDGDRGINNKISYSIIAGPNDIFAITPETGIVYTKTTIDRESDQSANGAFIIGIRAYEEGGNGPDRPFVDTEVTIVIEVISTNCWFPLFT